MFKVFVVISQIAMLNSHLKNLAWNGGPMHLQCENAVDLWMSSGYVKENVIAVKTLPYQDEIYVITPRYEG